jgi:mannitol operon transcriptional antiterminator
MVTGIGLNSRSRALLQMLLQAEGPLTAESLAARLGVTPRVVRFQLNSAQQSLASQGATLAGRPKCGFEIEAAPHTKASLLHRLNSDDQVVFHCPSERVYQLLLLMFTQAKPLLAKQLWNQFQVSRSTILSDLTKARMWLEGHGLFLLRRSSFGLELRGDESRIRQAFVALLLEVFERSELLTLCSSSRPGLALRQVSTATDLYPECLQPITTRLGFARTLVHSWQDLIRAELTDDAYIALTLYLAVLMARLSQGRSAPDEPGQLQIWHRWHGSPSIQLIIQRLQRYLCCGLSQGDAAGLEAQLRVARVRKALSATNTESDETQVRAIVDAMLDEASAYLHPWLKADRELRSNLICHLQPTLHRLQADLPIENPLLKDIQEFDGYAYQVAKRCAQILGAEVAKPVPPEEIGYIAMHWGAAMERVRPPNPVRKRVLVVCGEGSATAWMLVSRLRTEFPGIEISALKPARQVCQGDLYGMDAVVSTFPCQTADVPWRIVSPLLPPKDVASVREVLASGQPAMTNGAASIQEWSGPRLCDLIARDSIALRVRAADWADVVNEATSLLQDTGAVDASYGRRSKK